MKIAQALTLFVALTGVATAHDSWIQPDSYQTSQGARLPVTFFVGHSGEEHSARLLPRPAWLQSMHVHGPQGSSSLINSQRFTRAGVSLRTTGTYLLALETNNFENTAEPAKFAEYLQEEGLAAAQAAWARTPVIGRNVRETYRRHAKAVVQVGTGAGALSGPATRRLGQRLEIVPTVNPLSLREGEALGGTIWYQNRLLPGALVTLGSLDRPKDPLLKVRSDSTGKYNFRMPGSGRWMLNVVWSVPGKQRSDFETSFSSLTFAARPRR